MARRRAGSKSAAAFRTISEVAEELQLPQHVLRFWETKFDEVQPLKRGGGRRYYRPEDVDLLRRLRDLLYSDGYTIRDVQQFLAEGQIEVPHILRQTRRNGGRQGQDPPDGQANGSSSADEAATSGDSAELDHQHRHELEQVLADLKAAREQLRRDGLRSGD